VRVLPTNSPSWCSPNSTATGVGSAPTGAPHLGAVVDITSPDTIDVEFVAASGRTQALVTLHPTDLRNVADDDLLAVRRVERPRNQQ